MVSPGCQDGGKRRLVRLRPGVGLNIDVFCAEQLLRAVPGEVLHLVGVLTSAVISLARVAFRVLVGEDTAGGFEDGFRGEILTGNQFDLAVLPVRFFADKTVDLGIDFR